jgi:hypothetical protein
MDPSEFCFHSLEEYVTITCVIYTFNAFFLSHIRNMKKYCNGEKIDLEILKDLSFISPFSIREKFVSGIPCVCICAPR